jgi:hypothetical protein
MSKKHYILFAKMINDRIEDLKGGRYAHANSRIQELEIITREMIHIFQQDNFLFDRDRFYTACGFTFDTEHGCWRIIIHD